MGNPNDNFTGNNGDAPNSSRWTISNGTPDIYNNSLKLDTVVATGDGDKVLSKFWFTGDFDIQIDYDAGGDSATNSWNLVLSVFIDSTHRIFIGPTYTGNAKVYQRGAVNGGSWSYSNYARSLTVGKLRIVRSGIAFTVYYWNGSSWTAAGASYNIGSVGNSVYVWLGIAKWDTNPSRTGYFDNFVVNSGTGIFPPTTAPPTTPAPTTIAPTTSPVNNYSDSLSLGLSTTISNTDQMNSLDSISLSNVNSIGMLSIIDALEYSSLTALGLFAPSSILDAFEEVILNANPNILGSDIDLFVPIDFPVISRLRLREFISVNSSINIYVTARLGIVDKVWNRRHINANPAIDWLTLVGNDVWPFIPQYARPHYNEGNLISDAGNDVWDEVINGIPVTPQHRPWCGYWWRRDVGGSYGPPRTGIGPSPSPVPIPHPEPDPDWCVGCWGPQQQLHFCPNGKDIIITPAIVCGLDPIVAAAMYSGSGTVALSGSIGVYTPGNGGPAIVTFSTQSGIECYAFISDLSDHNCCGSSSIGYTTNHMSPSDTGEGNSQQQLTVVDGNDLSSYSFELISGPGSLTSDGLYTAPESNPGCVPTVIGLYCNDDLIDTLTISVGVEDGNAGYYSYCLPQKIEYSCSAQIIKKTLYCSGYVEPFFYDGCSTIHHSGCDNDNYQDVWAGLCEDAGSEAGCPDGGYTDTRTQDQINQGCCPVQLM